MGGFAASPPPEGKTQRDKVPLRLAVVDTVALTRPGGGYL